jgi:isoleucyl-tRNA synthetase
MRAAKTIASTSEAAVRVRVRAAERARLERFSAELPGFLLVAEVALEPAAAADAAAFEVTAAPADPARYRKCERCWMHRDDVSAEGLCGRCRDALARGQATAR